MSCLQPIDQGIGYSLKVNFLCGLLLYKPPIKFNTYRFFCRHNIDVLYVKNRLDAYDAITEENPIPSDITIYDSINFAARAWENVSANTIIRSWNRANILPSTMSTQNNLDSTSEESELETEIVNLIEQLPIDDPLEAREFVEIDDFMGVEEK